jgi:transposase
MSFIRKIRVKGRVYLSEVESKKINGKVVQRHIRYIGKEVDGQAILSTSISDVEVEQVKLYGPLLVLHHLAQEIGLMDHLGPWGREILSLVYAHCLDYESINQMPTWFKRTDLNMLLNLEELTEERLLKALDSLVAQDPDLIQRAIFESVKKVYSIHDSGIIYDVTNTYLYGKKCSLGKEGKDKEGVRGRPLIQIGLAVTKEAGFPVFHKTFDGNIHDSKTFQDVLTSFGRYSLMPGGLIIYDRGVTSGRNIIDVKALKWDTLCGVATNPKLERLWRPVLLGGSLIQFGNRVRLNETIFYVSTRPYKIGGIRGELALCFNEQKQRRLRESRYDEIADAQVFLKNRQSIKHDLEKLIDRQGRVIQSKLREVEAFDGCSYIFSTGRLSKEEMVRLYFDKDLVEKAFHSIKGITRLQPIRHWLSNRVKAHVFICYLSYLLLSLLKYRLKKIKISPEAALRELGTMYKVYLKDRQGHFKISRVVTLTKKQESILKTIDKKLLTGSV